MGFGMATHLVSQGYPVIGFDVYAPTISRFVAEGGLAASSLADAAQMDTVVMVATAAQVQAAVFEAEGALEALPKGARLLLCSTTPSVFVQGMQAELERKGRGDVLLVDCPVSGGALRAAQGKLSIMAGGSAEAVAQARFLLEEMADRGKLAVVKGGVGAGSDMKMAHQVLAAIHILAASEAMGLAAKLGLDLGWVREKVVGSEGRSFMFENRSPRMLEERYVPPASALTISLKDAGIVTSMASLRGFPTPLASTVEQVYLSGLSLGMGPEDDAGLIRLYYPKPLSQLPKSLNEQTESQTKFIVDLLASIHLCAAAEAIAFVEHLGLEQAQFSDVVNAAAGGSWMFRERGPGMIAKREARGKGSSVPKEQQRSIESWIESLSAVVQAARDVNCPLYLGNEVLNLLLVMKRKGWGECADCSIVKFWDSSAET
ncbi:hypothetical protein MMC13_007669 [Lambiella insularis]|nr:hypothetical protein [Lambiella insularis]